MKNNQGNLSSTSVPKLLHLIYKDRVSAGILDIVREPIKKRFFFKEGIPVFATSNILGEVLGRLLMSEGIISQREYESSLEVVLKKKRKHGEVLISMGLITPDELSTFLQLQLKRRIWKIFDWNEGIYRYARAEKLPKGVVHMPIHPARLILDGISLGFYPLERINRDLEDYMESPVEYDRKAGFYSLDDFGLKIQEKRFVDACDGQKTLGEVFAATELLRQRALSLALSFVITGVVKRPGRAEELVDEALPADAERPAAHATGSAEGVATGDHRVNAELLFMKAKNCFNEGNYETAEKILKEITELNPLEGEYWAWLGWVIFNLDPSRIKVAEKIIKDSIDINNELDTAWFFLGRICLAQGSLHGAQAAFKTAYTKNPWMLEAVSELKRLEIAKGLKASLYGTEQKPRRPSYMDAFGYTEDPFSDVPMDRPLNLSAGQEEALEFLLRSIKKKGGPLLLEGEKGAGKTTLLLELLKKLSNTRTLSAVILDPPKKELNLIKAVNEEVGSPTEAASVKEQLLSLGMRISQNKIQSGHTVIIIDEAHKLTDGCLKLLQYLARLKSLQIILLSEPGMGSRLATPPFKELDGKVLARAVIQPHTAAEIDAYVEKRLIEAARGAAPGKPFYTLTDEEQKELRVESRGIPALINEKCADILSRAAGGAQDKVPPRHPLPEAPQAHETNKPLEKSFKTKGPKPSVPEGSGVESEPTSAINIKAKAGILKETTPPAETPLKTGVIEFPAPAGKEKAEEKLTGLKGAEKAGAAQIKPSDKMRPSRLLFWVVVMLLLGLITGSIIGLFWLDKLGGLQ